MKPKRDGAATRREISEPTTTVRVTDGDELGVWVLGAGIPVVLVHGAAIWTLLQPLAEELAGKGGYRVIWFHRRGYNGRPTEPPVDWADQARDIVAILDALDVEKAHVVGHSAAAAYVLELATIAQDRLLSAALLDFTLPDARHVPSAEGFMQGVRPLMERAKAGEAVGAAADFLAGVGAGKDLLERHLPGSWSVLEEDAATMFEVEFPASMRWRADPQRIAAIDVPLAIAVVTRRPPFLETSERIRQWIPHATELEIDTDSHFFPITATAETAAAIDGWIESQGASAPRGRRT